ncbi:hypothetical protein [Caulobacter sp. Root1472]|uniref:hypothetical protein n=1 Tax=Caulobacter sp. Root1472 TaxID=1736470 RepID=UPI0007022C6E|nr:hypothetical protein [Caulobacter sp. Root1472]KQZ28490.1 hypothetical protein ASD47_21925 [Caulobacter sp. Root1472]
MTDRPSDFELNATARALFAAGMRHGWWPAHLRAYDDLDPIGRDEFNAIVEHVPAVAAKARAEESAPL